MIEGHGILPRDLRKHMENITLTHMIEFESCAINAFRFMQINTEQFDAATKRHTQEEIDNMTNHLREMTDLQLIMRLHKVSGLAEGMCHNLLDFIFAKKTQKTDRENGDG